MLYPHSKNRQILTNRINNTDAHQFYMYSQSCIYTILRGEDVVYYWSGVWRYLRMDKQISPHAFCL